MGAMVDAVRGNSDAMKLIDGAQVELSVTWDHDGRACKGRVDALKMIGDESDPRYIIVDLKTTQDVSPRGFARTVANYHYHGQLAFYSDGLHSNGVQCVGHAIIAVQNSHPFDCAVYDLHDIVPQGRWQYQQWLEKLAWCEKYDLWPGVQGDDGQLVLELPKWAETPSAWRDGEEEDWT